MEVAVGSVVLPTPFVLDPEHKYQEKKLKSYLELCLLYMYVLKRLSLHTSQVAHQAGAYPGFCSMKRLRVFLLPPGWEASPSQGYPQH